MNYCPNCGTEMHGRFCSNCGFDSQKEKKPNFFTRVKEWFQKAWAWIKGNKKLSILIGSSAVAVLTLVIVFSSLSNVFRVGKVNNIELGMSKEEVTDILGDPTETLDDDSTYCWYEKKAAKKIEKINGSFDDMLDMDEDISEEDFEDAFEEADGEYSELEEMTFKAIIVEFSSNKVTRVVFDKNHKYDEFDEYATAEEKVVKKMEMDVEEDISVNLITIERETGTETQGNIQPFEYTATFEDGSYVLGTANPKIEKNEDKGIHLQWSDAFAKYSLDNSVKITTMTVKEDGTLTAWEGNVVSFEIPEGITSIEAGAFSSYHLISVTIPESVTSIGESAFSNCPKLVEIYNKSAATVTIRNYGFRPNVYSPASGESKLTTDKDGYIIYTNGEDKILMGYVGTKTNLKLPKEITLICRYAFYGNNTLKTVWCNNRVIQDGAFYNCKQLKYIIHISMLAMLDGYENIYDQSTTIINALHFYVIVACFIIVALIFAIFAEKIITRKQGSSMKALYHHISADSSVEITLANGTKQSTATYLQERKTIFSEHFKKCHKKRKNEKRIIGFIIGFGLISSFLLIGGGIGTGFFDADDALFELYFSLSVIYFYLIVLICPFAFAFHYRSRKRKAERKLYDEQLKVLECYYPDKTPIKNKKNGNLETMLEHVGLTWTKEELTQS